MANNSGARSEAAAVVTERSRRLEQFFEFSLDGYLITDTKGIIVEANRAAAQLLGVSPLELIGVSLLGFLAQADRDALEASLPHLRKSLRVQEKDVEVRTADGRAFPAAVRIVGIRDEHARLLCLNWLVRDINERKKSEAAAHTSQSRLTGIIDSAMDAIVTVDSDQRIRVFNAAAERMFGCSAAEAFGHLLDRFIPPDLRETHRKHIEDFGRSKATTRAMGRLNTLTALRASGEKFPIEASISQVGTGPEKLYTAIIRDVTLRDQAERAVREAEARFRAMFEQAPVGIAVSDLDGRLVETNGAFSEMLGYAPQALHGLSYVQTTHPKDVRATHELLRKLIDGRADYAKAEKRFTRKDGQVVWGRVTYSIVRDPGNKPLYLLKMVEDITPRKRAEAAARRKRAVHQERERQLAFLTPREREVLDGIVAGKATKVIAMQLGASPKTIDVHRGRIMKKMGAQTVVHLVRMVGPLVSGGELA